MVPPPQMCTVANTSLLHQMLFPSKEVLTSYNGALYLTTAAPIPLIIPSLGNFPSLHPLKLILTSVAFTLSCGSSISASQTALLLQHPGHLYLNTAAFCLSPQWLQTPLSCVFHFQCSKLCFSSEGFHRRGSLCDEQPILLQTGSKLKGSMVIMEWRASTRKGRAVFPLPSSSCLWDL